MTVVYDPIPFKLVQKILVGNYEPIMRIFGKICIINLHNLQMLFMLWIKNKFSECLAPCPNMKTPNERLSGDGSAQARRHGGAFGGSFPPNFFCAPTNFVMLRKFILNIG